MSLFARFAPSYMGSDPEPVVNAPPWIQNMTGSVAWGSRLGVQTFRFRQSSPDGSVSQRVSMNTRPALPANHLFGGGSCGQMFPKRVASRIPDQRSGGAGGSQRRSPETGAAYGMPLKAKTPPASLPASTPWETVTLSSRR